MSSVAAADAKKARSKRRWALVKSFMAEKLKNPEGGTIKLNEADGACRLRFKFFEDKVSESDEAQSTQTVQWSIADGVSLSLLQRLEGIIALDDVERAKASRIDNTGNVALWHEETLAYWCRENASLFAGKTVCELGAGMTGMAGLVVAATTGATAVHITDGHPVCGEFIERNIERHSAVFPSGCSVTGGALVWDRNATIDAFPGAPFDVVTVADCLFFKQFHEDLIHTLKIMLKPDGIIYILAPHRGDSLDIFKTKASEVFEIEDVERYDDAIWAHHCAFLQSSGATPPAAEGASEGGGESAGAAEGNLDLYNPNMHYPHRLTLKLKTSSSS